MKAWGKGLQNKNLIQSFDWKLNRFSPPLLSPTKAKRKSEKKRFDWLLFFIIFPFYSFLYFWLPTVTRESAKVSDEVVPLELKSDQMLKIWKLHQRTDPNSRPFVHTMNLGAFSSDFLRLLYFLRPTQLSVWIFPNSLVGVKIGKLVTRRRGVGRSKKWWLFSPYYILHILFQRTPIKVLRGFILQAGKLSVSLLVECEFPMVIQLIGGRIGIQNSVWFQNPCPYPLPVSWSPFWKEHKKAVLCLSYLC